MPHLTKQSLYQFACLLLLAGLFNSCKEILPKPTEITRIPVDTSKIDSLRLVDSLPSFNSPVGLAVDGVGNIYVADYGNNLIRKITSGGVVSTYAGNGNEGNSNGTNNLASFNSPTGIAIDGAGNLYVADSGNDLIRQITSSGNVLNFAGGDTIVAENGIGRHSSFSSPIGITIDAGGNLFVADAGNNLIRKIAPDSTVTTFATSPSGFANLINNPTGVAVDNKGNVYIANYLSNNILISDNLGNINVFAGSGSFGNSNGSLATASFYYPNSVAVDNKRNIIYVADGVNNLIREITPDGMVSTFAGSGRADIIANGKGTNASFNGPSGLAVDAAGNVYVADTNNNLIRKITPDGTVSTVAGNGHQGAHNGKMLARVKKMLVNSSHKNTVKIFNKHRF